MKELVRMNANAMNKTQSEDWSFISDVLSSSKMAKRNYNTYVCIDVCSGLFKIGRATDVKKRIKQLSVANPNLELILTIKGNHETELHHKYASKREKSEWFRLSKEDIVEIKNKYELI